MLERANDSALHKKRLENLQDDVSKLQMELIESRAERDKQAETLRRISDDYDSMRYKVEDYEKMSRQVEHLKGAFEATSDRLKEAKDAHEVELLNRTAAEARFEAEVFSLFLLSPPRVFEALKDGRGGRRLATEAFRPPGAVTSSERREREASFPSLLLGERARNSPRQSTSALLSISFIPCSAVQSVRRDHGDAPPDSQRAFAGARSSAHRA